jgi:recombinational DNA repair protein RecR
MSGAYTIDDVISLYVTAKDKDKQIFILAQLTASDVETIIEVLKDNGIYEEKGIQECFNCHELFISYNRNRVCETCKRKNRRERRMKNE